MAVEEFAGVVCSVYSDEGVGVAGTDEVWCLCGVAGVSCADYVLSVIVGSVAADSSVAASAGVLCELGSVGSAGEEVGACDWCLCY